MTESPPDDLDIESAMPHVVKVAIAAGVAIGLTGFSLLLYASDFWSTPVPTGQGEPQVAAHVEAPVPQAPTRDFAQRVAEWAFGPPQQEMSP